MNNTTTTTKSTNCFDVRRLVFTALLGALAVVLMKFLSFPLPFIPNFITFDFSDVPALLASLTFPTLSSAVCSSFRRVSSQKRRPTP